MPAKHKAIPFAELEEIADFLLELPEKDFEKLVKLLRIVQRGDETAAGIVLELVKKRVG